MKEAFGQPKPWEFKKRVDFTGQKLRFKGCNLPQDYMSQNLQLKQCPKIEVEGK